MEKDRKKQSEAYIAEIDQLLNEANKHCAQCIAKRKKANQILKRWVRLRGGKNVK